MTEAADLGELGELDIDPRVFHLLLVDDSTIQALTLLAAALANEDPGGARQIGERIRDELLPRRKAILEELIKASE